MIASWCTKCMHPPRAAYTMYQGLGTRLRLVSFPDQTPHAREFGAGNARFLHDVNSFKGCATRLQRCVQFLETRGQRSIHRTCLKMSFDAYLDLDRQARKLGSFLSE